MNRIHDIGPRRIDQLELDSPCGTRCMFVCNGGRLRLGSASPASPATKQSGSRRTGDRGRECCDLNPSDVDGGRDHSRNDGHCSICRLSKFHSSLIPIGDGTGTRYSPQRLSLSLVIEKESVDSIPVFSGTEPKWDNRPAYDPLRFKSFGSSRTPTNWRSAKRGEPRSTRVSFVSTEAQKGTEKQCGA